MKEYDNFTQNLLNWFNKNKRNLPWRHTSDPYKIWLSEIILQQTRVNQGLPYYLKFIKSFPNIYALANAPLEKVLRSWQGLGYYSRARNLHHCAQQVVQVHEGVFPSEFDALLKLKGIGRYTAAAIASIAFNQCVPVIDGNVYRVIARLYGIKDDINLSGTYRKFHEILTEIISCEQPGIFNQALMEFGATHCTPSKPKCNECPFENTCYAKLNGEVSSLPVKIPKVKIRNRYFNYIVFSYGNQLALKEREDQDIWKGLYQFELLETDNRITDTEILDLLKISSEMEIKNIHTYKKHILTHQHIYARFVEVKLKAIPDSFQMHFYSPEEIEQLPKPTLIIKYLNDHYF